MGYFVRAESNSVFNSPLILFLPGVAIMVTILSFNLVGDGLRGHSILFLEITFKEIGYLKAAGKSDGFFVGNKEPVLYVI
jgi:hypothetical protein